MASAELINSWIVQRDSKIVQLNAISSTIDSILGDGVASATFDTGVSGARQAYVALPIDKLMAMQSKLESQINRLDRMIRTGGGLNSGVVRRYG